MKGLRTHIGLALMLSGALLAQAAGDARSTGMAFSNAAATEGLEQIGLNPATLALHTDYRFELNLVSLRAGISNNSFSRSFYDRYFTTGDSLSDADKGEILGRIPLDGLDGNVSANANLFAIYLPYFSFALSGVGNGSFTLPRELFDLALYGNDELGRIYDFSTLEGVGWGGLSASVSGAYRFDLPKWDGFDYLAVGMTFKYVAGLGYVEAVTGAATFENLTLEDATLRLNGLMQARTATGGSGMGIDIGVLAQASNRFTYSLALINALGSVKWDREAEYQYYDFEADTMALGLDGFEDSFSDGDSSEAIESFSTRMPAILDLGAAYQLNEQVLLSAQLEQELSHSMGAHGATRLAFGSELRFLNMLPLRFGMSFGGHTGTAFATGVGLDLHYWILDVGVMNHGTIIGGGSRGMTLSLTTRLRF